MAAPRSPWQSGPLRSLESLCRVSPCAQALQIKQAKKAWFHAQVQSMELASSTGGVRALFRLAGAFMPKQPKRRLQLRGPRGEIWSPEQQVTCLKDFFCDLYAPCDEPPLPPLPELVAPVISTVEAQQCLSNHLAPTAATVACADILAPWLSSKIQSLTAFPSVWSECWLALLPKVLNRTMPRQLRPAGCLRAICRTPSNPICWHMWALGHSWHISRVEEPARLCGEFFAIATVSTPQDVARRTTYTRHGSSRSVLRARPKPHPDLPLWGHPGLSGSLAGL